MAKEGGVPLYRVRQQLLNRYYKILISSYSGLIIINSRWGTRTFCNKQVIRMVEIRGRGL